MLTQHEIASSTWQKIEEHLKGKLVKLRERIENPRIVEAERMQLAWTISTIKEFLALAAPVRVTEAVADD